jgi:nucleotide-binding universal stress UspA family protein
VSIHLLVPLDSSQWSRAAGNIAMQLAEAQPSRVTAVHVVNVRSASGNILQDLPGHLGFEPAVVSDDIVRAHTEAAQALLQRFAELADEKGLDHEERVETGTVSDTLLSLGEGADLVVMGVRGETEEKFQGQGGALCAWLPPRLDTPVLWAVPGAYPVQGIAVGYDGSVAAKHAVRAIRHFLEPLKVPVHGIYVSSDGSGGEILDELAGELPQCNVVPHVIQGTDPHLTLIETAEAVGAQLLVLGFKGKSRLKDFLFGTSTERILLSGKVAVLISH